MTKTTWTEKLRKWRRDHEEELAALKAEYEARLEAQDREQLAAQADRLRQRLLQLAGYGDGQAS